MVVIDVAPSYKRIVTSTKVSNLPDTLRHQFRYSLYLDESNRALGNPIISFQQSVPKLAGKKVTLSFKPASPADTDLIASFLPQPHADGSPIQPSEIPTALPGYMIKVTPELKVEGSTVASGGSFTMGTDLLGEGGFTQYHLQGWDLDTDATIVAGQASTIGLSLEGISAKQLTDLKTRMEQTKAKLDAKDVTALTNSDITGDLLTATVWSWFAIRSATR